MTPTDNPLKALELTQLIADLKIVVSPVLYTDEGFARVAEALYDRGVRSKLHAPRRDGDSLVHFAWDPALEGFEITEPGVYELRMEAVDPPDIEPFPTFPRTPFPPMLHRLVKKAGVRPVLTGPTSRRCPWCEWSYDALDDGRIPFHKRSFMTDWMECQGSRHLVEENGGVVLQQMSEVPGHVQAFPAPGVPKPLFERPLPQGVYNVIHFVQARRAIKPDGDVVASATLQGDHTRPLRLTDLETLLAEIPDVAPRYPTIWAYEQACRTIRERDERLQRVLDLLDEVPTTTEEMLEKLNAIRHAAVLRMPRLEPATEQERSEVARAFEACDTDDDAEVGDAWSGIARTLRDEALRLADVIGDQQDDLTSVVLTDAAGELVPCGTCSALEPPVERFAVGRSGRGWPRCAQHLVEDALDDAGLEKTVKRCSSCSHLASAHYEDGSGCSVTIRDVSLGADGHCPCTFDARSVHRG